MTTTTITSPVAKTRDGIPITTGMRVFTPNHNWAVVTAVVSGVLVKTTGGDFTGKHLHAHG